ncbi:MAG: nucleoside triphosphate pyrophosphohydrolase [Gemmatimonadota bacterium]|nr:nucleoside triphosphate pyrophosphohydrolase [Gemmatimonadota bacterium]
MKKINEDFSGISTVEQLAELVDHLRSDKGCPWDAKQTSRSLKPYMLEEVYELLEAIETGDPEAVRNELGDVLLHLCFQVCLGREAGTFDLADVVAAVRDKMIRRHPHVFGDATFESRKDQLFAWEQIKKQEKSGAGHGDQEDQSVLEGLPGNLPPLLKSYRIQGRVSHYRFDWEKPEEVFDKIEEEIAELKESIKSGDPAEIEQELGDLLFTVVNLSRLLGVHPKLALERTNSKFIRRFKHMEQLIRRRGQALGEMSLPELDEVWEEVKNSEIAPGTEGEKTT